jgi:DNA-binding IclR family transcriptional regulator
MVLPGHASALGRAQLAFLPSDAERQLAASDAAVRRHLGEIARAAIAGENDDVVLGESGIAAPIFGARGAAIGAIGVVVPTTDWPVAEAVRDALREAARNISRELGAARWPAPLST